MTPAEEFPQLLDLALADVLVTTQALVEKHELKKYPQWQLIAEQSQLRFGDVAFLVQMAGALETATLRWRWAWADPTVPPNLLRAVGIASGFGKANEIPVLTTPTIFATEEMCWKLTAFTARMAGWPGIYRAPLQNGLIIHLLYHPLVPGMAEQLMASPKNDPAPPVITQAPPKNDPEPPDEPSVPPYDPFGPIRV